MSFIASYPELPLTDTQLRATPVVVSVTGGEINIENASLTVDLSAFLPIPDSVLIVGTVDGTESGMKAVLQVDLDGVLAVNGSQFTQPVSALALPLPLGAATSALQTTGNVLLTSIDGKLTSPVTIVGTVNSVQSGTYTVGVNNFPSSQAVTGPLTDTQLRAVPVPISGTVAVTNIDVALSTRLKSADTLAGVTLIGTVSTITNVVHIDDNGGSLTIDGSVSILNFPATQAVTQSTSPWVISGTVTGPLTDTQLRASPVPVSGTFFQVTQPISVVSLPLPLGAATEATLATMLTLAGFQARINTLGQKTMANSTPVVLASDQSSIPTASTQSGTWTVQPGNTANTTAWKVDGSAATQPVSGPLTDTQLRASPVPISGTVTANAGTNLNTSSLALEATLSALNAKVTTVNTGAVTISAALPSGTNGIGKLTANSGVTIGAIEIAAAQTLATITTVGTVSAVTAISNALPAGNNNIGDVDVASIASGTNRIGAVRLVDGSDATLASVKSTQTAQAVGVQQLHDAGRTELRYSAVAAASGATTVETLMTLTKSSGVAATSTGTSFVITAGKIFRITSITVATRGNATATIQTTTFNLRVNSAGATIVSSTPIVLSLRSATAAVASDWDRVYLQFPEGWEIVGDGTRTFGISAAATFTTNAPTWDVFIQGYEY